MNKLEEIIPGVNTLWLPVLHQERHFNRLCIVLRSPEPFAMDLSPKHFKEKCPEFQNQVVVDLGAGRTSHGYKLAVAAGAKGYVGVEPIHAEILSSDLRGEQEIPWCVIPQDMYHFLRRVPKDSVSIISTGVEYLPEGYDEFSEREIERVLHPEGACFVYGSSLRPNLKRTGVEVGALSGYNCAKFTK